MVSGWLSDAMVSDQVAADHRVRSEVEGTLVPSIQKYPSQWKTDSSQDPYNETVAFGYGKIQK